MITLSKNDDPWDICVKIELFNINISFTSGFFLYNIMMHHPLMLLWTSEHLFTSKDEAVITGDVSAEKTIMNKFRNTLYFFIRIYLVTENGYKGKKGVV